MADTNLWRDRNKVFVAGIPLHIDDAGLYEKFKPYGEMFQSKIVYDRNSGRSKGFGFITFCEYINALEAVNKLNQTKWDGRVLNVRFLDPKGQDGGAQGDAGVAKKSSKVFGPRPENCTTIYVGNLAYDITDEVLRKVFEKCGDVKAIRFAEHIQTKEFRGFGYVQFYEGLAVEEAVKLDGMIVMGRPMNIDYGDRDEATTKMREELQKKLKKGICNKYQMGQCDRGDECKFAHILKDQDAEEVVAAATGVKRTSTPILNPVQRETQSNQPSSSSQAPSDAPVCINYQKGKCKRGAACRFQHLDGGAVASVAVPAEEPAHQSSVNSVVQPQDVTPMEVQPTEAEDDAPICQNFVKAKCKRGAKCRFRHVIGGPQVVELQQAQEEEASHNSFTCSSSSSSYHSSRLPGPRVERPVEVVPEISVCLNFQKGKCRRGASCRFAHTSSTTGTTVNPKEAEEVSLYQKRFQSICYNWQKTGSCVRGDKCPFEHEGAPVNSNSTPTTEEEEEGEKSISTAVVDDDEDEKAKKKKKIKSKKRERDQEKEEEEESSMKDKKEKKKKKKKASRSDQ